MNYIGIISVLTALLFAGGCSGTATGESDSPCQKDTAGAAEKDINHPDLSEPEDSELPEELTETLSDGDLLQGSDTESLPHGDADSDGIPDTVEMPNGIAVDTDKDGTPDYQDTDSDGDGVSDTVEGTADADGDGAPNYRDTDSDGDGVLDCAEVGNNEKPVDSDGDGLPDYHDPDADNDGIMDGYEGTKDADGDGTPNYLDNDADDDGIADCLEKNGKTFKDTDKDGYPDCKAKPDVSVAPADTDGDGAYDFIDNDADGDGLADSQELVCPNLKKDGRVWSDVDGDGFSDLAEKAVGSKVCDATEGVTDIEGIDFYFELPYKQPEKTDVLVFTPSVQKADIFFNVDTTGSMDGELYNLKHSLSSTIIPQTRLKIADSAFGAAQFRDENEPSLIQNNPVTDTFVTQQSVNALTAEYGGDGPEAGYFGLNNLAVSGQWRSGTIPIAVHITDAVSHERGVSSKAAVIDALKAEGIRVITVFSTGGYDGAAAQVQLTELSEATGAKVPECAGAGRTTLMYSIDENGNGLDAAVVNGIDALVKYAPFSVLTGTGDDGSSQTLDTACFIKKIEALAFTPPPGDTCAPAAEKAMLNGASYYNGFTGFVTGTSNPQVTGSSLTFTVHAENDTCMPPADHAQVFTAVIYVVDATTGSVLDAQNVTIIVPGEIKNLNES